MSGRGAVPSDPGAAGGVVTVGGVWAIMASARCVPARLSSCQIAPGRHVFQRLCTKQAAVPPVPGGEADYGMDRLIRFGRFDRIDYDPGLAYARPRGSPPGLR